MKAKVRMMRLLALKIKEKDHELVCRQPQKGGKGKEMDSQVFQKEVQQTC